MKKIVVSVLTAAIIAGTLTGCNGNKPIETGETTTAQKTETQGTTETVQTVDSDKYGGSVNLCYPEEPTTFFLPFSASTGDRASAAPALESLGRVDLEGNTNGWLAESIVSDPEALTCTITLKRGIKFSDGTDFNAEALIWNFDKMKEAGKTSELGNPISYEAVDDHTVILTYDSWANNWDTVIGEVFVYSPEAFEKNGEDWAAINPDL